MLEATDQTMIMGFTDDVVVRVEGTLNRSRIDIRSASRYGVVDFGQNAYPRAPLPRRVEGPLGDDGPADRRPPRTAFDAHRRDG